MPLMICALPISQTVLFTKAEALQAGKALLILLPIFQKPVWVLLMQNEETLGNTSSMYAKAFFDESSSGMSFDAITIAPYMGSDSVKPFLAFDGKWVILLALTSNQGGKDFQFIETENGRLFEQVIQTANTWADKDRLMYVVGATRAEEFISIRKHAPDHFLLVPGVGAQGGSLKEVCKYGLSKDCGLLVNSSRSIIFASSGRDFADKAREETKKLQAEMSEILDGIGM